jgi:hypothetical protein
MKWTGGPLGLVQTTGEHAIVTRQACRPGAGSYGDPCQNLFVDIAREGQADERVTGAQLALKALVEPDADGDLRGDTTEDRTDLQLTMLPTLAADGRWSVAVTVHNAGPLPADVPIAKVTGVPSRWQSGCTSERTGTCSLAPLAVGETRTLTLLTDSPTGQGPWVTVSAEGPDLVSTDNTRSFIVGPPPPFALTTAKKQSLRKGIKVEVRGQHAGRARVTAAFKVNGRTVKIARTVKLAAYTARSVTMRPTGAKLRSLKRALKKGPLNAEITVRTFSGKTPVTTKTVVS